jgi:DHA1 family tetracycline resistance protein-like MFS transporter
MTSAKARLLFLFITATLDMIGVGLIIPSLPDVVRRFVSDETLVMEYFGYFMSVYAAMQFIASPLLGSLSDLYGRRPLLLTSLLMAGLDYLMMAFAPSLTFLFVGRVISGLTGASITVCMAYVADISNDSNRSSNYGIIGAALGLGFIIGPALGGFLGQYSPEAPFLAAAFLNILNFLFGVFVLPESFPKEKRKKPDVKKLNPFVGLKQIFKTPVILTFSLVHFLFQLAGMTHPSIWTIYTEHRFGWSPGEVGLSLTLVGLLIALSQGWLSRKVIPKFGEQKTLLYCAFGNFISFILYGAAYEGWMMYGVILFTSLFFVAQPALQSLATKNIPENEQGEFQGTLVGLTSLASILNPLIVTRVFAYFSNKEGLYLPGAPYYLAALVSFVAWIVIVKRNYSTDRKNRLGSRPASLN